MAHLFNEINTSLQIHTEIDELPDNAFLLVFFLLQHEHVVVEELLQTLVGEVDADLLKSVVLAKETREISMDNGRSCLHHLLKNLLF